MRNVLDAQDFSKREFLTLIELMNPPQTGAS